MTKKSFYQRYVKRIMDFSLSLFALMILFPILIVIAFLVKTTMGSPIIFKQKRPGLNEKIFDLYKFRTMKNEKDEKGALLPDSVRLTKFGSFLRSTSLDEIPSLLNILRGEMSLVGPRPLLVSYLELYSDEQRTRHYVKPGLTGLAQINGRNAITWEKKFYYDIKYVSNITFLKDIKIIIRTLLRVLKRRDINNPGSQVVEHFKGNKKGVA